MIRLNEIIRIGLIQYAWCPYWKGKLDPETELQPVRSPCEEERRDRGDVFINQARPKSAREPLESGRKAWDRFSLPFLRRNQLTPWAQTSSSQNAEITHSYCSKSPSLWYFFHDSTSKWIHPFKKHMPIALLSWVGREGSAGSLIWRLESSGRVLFPVSSLLPLWPWDNLSGFHSVFQMKRNSLTLPSSWTL